MITENKLVIEGSKASKLRIGILCIGLDPGSRDSLELMVAQTAGAHVVENVDSRVSPREVMRLLEPFQFRICLIDFDEGIEECCRAANYLRANCDNTINLAAASSDSAPETIVATMRSGCSEFLFKPFDSERVSSALTHVASRRHIKEEGASGGQIITVIGAKGGTGVTSVAMHLGLHLISRHNKTCLLVDHHPALGDVSLYLGLSRRHLYSFYDLVNNTDRLDQELLQGHLLQHSAGLHVLDSPEVIDSYPHLMPEAIEHTLDFLSDRYNFVLVDCPPGMTDENCAAIRQSDRVAIVITPELAAVRNAVRTIQYLVGLHFPEDSIDVVLNRASRNSPLTEEDIETALRRPIAVRIPNHYGEVVKAINAGTPVPLDRNPKLSAAFDDWADRVIGVETASSAKSTGSRGWFGLFGF